MKALIISVLGLSLLINGEAWSLVSSRSLSFSASVREKSTVQNVLAVTKNIMVSSDKPKNIHVEPYVAANPKDSKHLVASSISYTRIDGRSTCTVFTSFDGGQKWTRATLPGLDKLDMFFAADPWVAFGPDDTVFSSCLVDRFRSPPEKGSANHVYLFRSIDGGQRWSEPLVMQRGRGRVAFDRTSIFGDVSKSKFAGSVYVYSSGVKYDGSGQMIFPPMLWRSTDGGRTFSGPKNFLPSNLNVNAMNVVVLSNGTVVLPFYDSTTRDQRFLKQPRLWVVTSSDGGESFSAPKFVAELSSEIPSVSTDIKLAVDQSTGFPDRLYMTWNTLQRGAANIYLSHSSDNGETWSDAVQVNDSKNKDLEYLHPAVAVNASGIVGISWFGLATEGGKRCSNLYFSASLDGGKTFLPSVRVSAAQSCADSPGNSVPYTADKNAGTVGQRWAVGGDYSGLAASSDGLFHLLWADSRTGVFQNWAATVRLNPK